MRFFLRYLLMTLNLLLACAAGILLIVERPDDDLVAIAFLPGALIFFATVALLKPYEKWVFDKPGKWEHLLLGAIFLIGLTIWAANAFGVSWATMQRFQATVALGLAVWGTALLYNLRRVRAFESS